MADDQDAFPDRPSAIAHRPYHMARAVYLTWMTVPGGRLRKTRTGTNETAVAVRAVLGCWTGDGGGRAGRGRNKRGGGVGGLWASGRVTGIVKAGPGPGGKPITRLKRNRSVTGGGAPACGTSNRPWSRAAMVPVRVNRPREEVT